MIHDTNYSMIPLHYNTITSYAKLAISFEIFNLSIKSYRRVIAALPSEIIEYSITTLLIS